MLRKERNDNCMVAMEWQPEGKRKVARLKTTNWIGHVLRKERNDDCMVAMEWQPEGKRKWDDLNLKGRESGT